MFLLSVKLHAIIAGHQEENMPTINPGLLLHLDLQSRFVNFHSYTGQDTNVLKCHWLRQHALALACLLLVIGTFLMSCCSRTSYNDANQTN